MKPGPRDHPHKLKICGEESLELRWRVGSMAEAFGLGRKIDKCAGLRPSTP